MNLVWFRMDLRLADNPALFHATENKAEVQALFIVNAEQHCIHGEAPQKYQFIKAHVNDLVERLGILGIRSLVYEVAQFADVAGLFEQLVSEYHIDGLYFNANYWANEIDRDQTVKQVLIDHDIPAYEYHSNYLLQPGTVRKADGSMYHVFTPYKNKFIDTLKQAYQLPVPVPEKKPSVTVEKSASLSADFTMPGWPIGEQAVSERVMQFTQYNDYHDERDFPATAGTSRLSPYLSIGVISAQQCLAHALKHEGEGAFHNTWVSELIWRDYYNDLMFEYPKLAKHHAFKADVMDTWQNAPELLKAWQEGQTGFPVVDAGMRQLLAEGWMHNRVRMIVASFLCKLCLVDWRLGEAHFMAHLLDGDLASNNGGWQWSSATGCDAAPYFRIFNPTTQSKKFDPDGLYIKTYVPELKGVDRKEIHDPKTETRKANKYPNPIIDYKMARKQALEWFKS